MVRLKQCLRLRECISRFLPLTPCNEFLHAVIEGDFGLPPEKLLRLRGICNTVSYVVHAATAELRLDSALGKPRQGARNGEDACSAPAPDIENFSVCVRFFHCKEKGPHNIVHGDKIPCLESILVDHRRLAVFES